MVFSVLFQPRQLTVVSGSEDGEVRVWDLVTKSCVHVLRVPPPPLPPGPPGTTEAVPGNAGLAGVHDITLLVVI